MSGLYVYYSTQEINSCQVYPVLNLYYAKIKSTMIILSQIVPFADDNTFVTYLVVGVAAVGILLYILKTDLSRIVNNKAVKTLHESLTYVADYDRTNALVTELMKPIVPQDSEKEKNKILELIERIEYSLDSFDVPEIQTSNITSLLKDIETAITTPKLLNNVTFDTYHNEAMKQILELHKK